MSTEAVLEVDGLRVQAGGRAILDEVSFTIEAGSFTGLIGANGAGKTTLLRTILGLAPASSGSVLIAGRRRTRRNPLVGYVPQRFALDPDLPLRVRDLVALGLDGHRLGLPLPSRARRTRVEELLDAVGLRELANERVGRLSGGEQQRVLIAHALISAPALLLADEPLANLDLRSGQTTVALLARIARERGVAILLSAHDMNPLLGVMDRVVYLAGGRAASGPTAEVVRSHVLSTLYGHHVDVLSVHGRVLVVAGAAGELDGAAAHDRRPGQVEIIS